MVSTSNPVTPSPVYQTVTSLADLKEGTIFSVEKKGKKDKFNIVTKDDKFQLRSLSKVIDMAKALEALNKELELQDDNIKRAPDRYSAWTQLTIRWDHMNQAIAKRNWFIRIIIQVAQVISGHSLNKAFFEVEKHFIPGKRNQAGLLCKKSVGPYAIQPGDAAVAERILRLKKDMKYLEDTITKQTKHQKIAWDDEDFRTNFDEIMQEAYDLSKRLLNDEFDLALHRWQDKFNDSKDDDDDATVDDVSSRFIMLDSNKTFLTEALQFMPQLYRLARFRAERMDARTGWSFKYDTKTPVDLDYTKQFYDGTSVFNKWRVLYNKFCDRLENKKPSTGTLWARIAEKDLSREEQIAIAKEKTPPPSPDPKKAKGSGIPSSALAATPIVQFKDFKDTFKAKLKIDPASPTKP